MTDKKPMTVEELVWAYLREAFCIPCPRCNGLECSFCEGKGWIYINNRFRRLHEKAIEIMKAWAQQEAEPLEQAVSDFCSKKELVDDQLIKSPYAAIKDGVSWREVDESEVRLHKALTTHRAKYGVKK